MREFELKITSAPVLRSLHSISFSPEKEKKEGGMGRAINEYGVFAAVGGDEEKVIVMTVAQLGEHTKNHYLYTFNQ